MSKMIKRDSSYSAWIEELKNRYQRSQIKAALSVSFELLEFYWMLGKDIVDMQAENVYGSGFYEALSNDLGRELPTVKGFSPRNLRYMKGFYELFSQLGENLPQAAANSEINSGQQNLPQAAAKSDSQNPMDEVPFPIIPWGHIRLLVDKCKIDADKAWFYAQKTLENNWSRAVLMNFLSTGLYERQGKAVSNFETTLPAPRGDLAQEITRDPYCFDFLAIRERYDEKELKDALMDNITRFLLELGNGFAFVGREYRLKVGQTEQWIDLLFYHIKLRCYVVVEVKATAFEPGFVGQLGTYVSAVNHIMKEEGDHPTVGLLICRDKDDVLARYALDSTSQPIGISEYELSELIPEEFKGSLPTIEEIEEELGGFSE
ncbi:MAG: DUF1016 family protein [Eggerthellaceae bacterium]|nr:DUF1016 family protein [Eggerthellaceae bacterium]